MNSRTYTALKTPVIGRVVMLNRYMINYGKKAYKLIQHNYIDSILKEGVLLFKHCYRQLLGLNYTKRVLETAYEIQAQAYFISSIGGWPAKVSAVIDEYCENIIQDISKISQNHQVKNNEGECAGWY